MPRSTVQLAREILSQSTTRSNSSRPIPPLLAKLAASLRETTAARVRSSMVPRTPSPPSPPSYPRQYLDDARLESMVVGSYAADSSLPSSRDQFGADDGSINDDAEAPLTMSEANATYGETPPGTIRMLLSALATAEYNRGHNDGFPSRGSSIQFAGDFIDAGSGHGLATVCAAETGHFLGRCRGVERDAERHGRATRLADKLLAWKSSSISISSRSGSSSPIGGNNSLGSRVDFACADLRDETFHGSSVVLANCVVWDADLCGAVGRRLDDAAMVGPSLVVTISRRMPSPSFDLVDILTMPCNGGEDFSFYVCQKSRSSGDSGIGVGRQRADSSFALSDSCQMRALREEDNLLEDLVGISMEHGNEGMAFLASAGASEPSARAMLQKKDDGAPLLSFLAQKLARDEDLGTRASSSMVLRALSDFPVGRRRIGESDEVVTALVRSLVEAGGGADHPAIRANVVDILGQILNDPVGNESVGSHNIDSLLETVRKDAVAKGWFDVVESCDETQTMRRWCGGEQRNLDGFSRN